MCIYIYTCIHTYIYTYTYIYIHVYIHIYIYYYVYIYISLLLIYTHSTSHIVALYPNDLLVNIPRQNAWAVWRKTTFACRSPASSSRNVRFRGAVLRWKFQHWVGLKVATLGGVPQLRSQLPVVMMK